MSSKRTTVIPPLDVGAATNRLGGNVGRGNCLLTATLNEMMNIRRFGNDLSGKRNPLLSPDFRARYDRLVVIDYLPIIHHGTHVLIV